MNLRESGLDVKSLRRAIKERSRLVMLTTGREDRAGVYGFYRLPLTRYPLPRVIVKDNRAKEKDSGSPEEMENLRIQRDLQL